LIYANFVSDRLYYFPVLTFKIDSDWVGFKVLVADPSIVSVSSTKATSGRKGGIVVVVKNNAESFGSFETSVSCDSVSVYNGLRSDNFDGGMSKSFSFGFDLNTNKAVSDDCSVTVTDKGSFKSVSKDFIVSVDPAVVCVGGSEYCEGLVRMQCKSDGSGFVVKSGDGSCLSKVCNTDADCVSGNQRCDVASGKCLSISPDQNCASKFGGLVTGVVGVEQSCSLWCKLGLAKVKSTNVCVYDYTLIWLIFGIVMVAGLVVFLVVRFGGRRKGGSRR
jgi:hypothetical protein